MTCDRRGGSGTGRWANGPGLGWVNAEGSGLVEVWHRSVERLPTNLQQVFRANMDTGSDDNRHDGHLQ